MFNYNSFILIPESYQIKIESNISTPQQDFFDGVVILPSTSFFQNKEVNFQVRLIKNMNVLISYENGKDIYIATEKTDNWKEFLTSHFLDVIGLITTFVVEPEGENILWIEPYDDESVWILGIVNKMNYWQGMLVKRARPELGSDYYLSGSYDRRHQARELLTKFETWLGTEFPFCFDVSKSERQLFTAKVNPNETWFLLFPLSHFCQFEFSYFRLFNEPEWIVSGKSFIQNTCERLQLQKELSVIENFLKHSVIIINNYSHWESKTIKRAQEGINMIKDVLVHFNDIDFQNDAPISLRWYINPTHNEILNELLNPDTWYFFADFHVNNGVWQIGEGQRCSWFNSVSINQTETKENRQLFNLDRKWDLSHHRLMRVFHCESVFNPYEIDGVPADAHSIVRLLLKAGAKRVEGGMTIESFFDYLCSLFDLLCCDQGLGPILEGKCLEAGISFGGQIEKINNYLISCDRDII